MLMLVTPAAAHAPASSNNPRYAHASAALLPRARQPVDGLSADGPRHLVGRLHGRFKGEMLGYVYHTLRRLRFAYRLHARERRAAQHRAADGRLRGREHRKAALQRPDGALPFQRAFACLRRLRNAVRPVAPAGVIAANRLDWSLLEGFERVEFESLFFTGGRGCPGACTFCAKLHGGEVRVKSAPQLLAEIEGADRMVAAGALRVQRWDLFKHVDDRELRPRRVAWVAVYDEDFFLHRKRAVEFFELWDRSPLNERYRLSLQTNPCSLLTSRGAVHAELLEWIDRLKPMVQLGAESFHPEVLARWNKRHDVGQLNAVLDALDKTGQDYTVFQLLTDFDTTAEELVESLRRLILAAYRRRRMRVASSPLTIPLYDSETRRLLEHDRRPGAGRAGHFTDYERPQPGWMDPLVADLADRADAELQWALEPEHRDGALLAAFEAVLDRIREERHRIGAAAGRGGRLWIGQLHDQALRALDQIKEARFQAIRPIG